MKKILLSAVVAFMAVSGQAQSPGVQVSPEALRQSISMPVNPVINTNPANPNGTLPIGMMGTARTAQETTVGASTYDLQTNSAIQRRIINHANGAITATWTYSNVNSWATRGTGYNYFNGTQWGSLPTSEIETERTGWPSPMRLASGKECCASSRGDMDVGAAGENCDSGGDGGRGRAGRGGGGEEVLDT